MSVLVARVDAIATHAASVVREVHGDEELRLVFSLTRLVDRF